MAEKDTITTKFRVDISDLKAGISEANKQIKLANAEFKAASAGMDDWSKSSDGLNAKLKQLGTLLTQEKTKLQSYKDQLNRQKEAYSENEKRVDELKAKLQQLASQGVSKTSDEYKKYQKALNDCEKEQISNQKEIDKLTITMNNQQGTVNGLEKDIRNYNKQLQDLENQQDDVNDSTGNMSDGFTVAKGALANLVADGIRRAIDALKELVTQTIEVGKSFDTAMSKVGAVSGATAEELEQLRDKAKEMGSTTKFTASEAAEAFNYMAMAGWKTEDMLAGIDGVLSLAAASGSDLATTSDIVTDALTAMGYTAKDVGKFADVMAAASSNANTNVEMMGLTFQYAAPIAGALGYSIEDLAVGIGLMANAGIKGEKSGTALRSIMTRLSAPPKECADAMKKLGISITNTDGTMKPLNEIMIALRKGFAGLSQAQQTQIAKSLAGQEAMSGLLAIVNATETDFNKLTTAVSKSSGAADKMSKTMQDNLGGDMTKLSSQIEGIQLQLYEKFEPTLRKVVKSISESLNKVDWDSFGRTVENAFKKALAAFEWIIDHKSLVVTALKLMIAAFAVRKVNQWVQPLNNVVKGFANLIINAKKSTTELNHNTTAQRANTTAQTLGAAAANTLKGATSKLWAVFKANPLGLVVSAVTAVISVFSLFGSKSKEVNEELEKQKEKIEENQNAWDELKNSQQNQINAGMTEMSYYQSLYDELTKIVDANGKVKDGYETRASFIVSTLNEALGTEINMTKGVIDKYDELKKTIDEVMEKKKAQIILDSQETLYSEAINKQGEALTTLKKIEDDLTASKEKGKELEDEYAAHIKKATEEAEKQGDVYVELYDGKAKTLKDSIKLQDETTANLQSNYDKQKNLTSEYAYNIGLYEKNMAAAHAGKYDEMSTATWKYVKEFQGAGEAEKKILEDQISTTQFHLDLLKEMKNKSGSDIYDSQIAAAEKQLEGLKTSLKQYESTTQEGLNKVEEDWKVSLGNQLSEIEGKKVEFKYAGNGLVQKYVDGVKEGEPTTKAEAEKLAKATIKKINDEKSNAETAGKNLAIGVGTGISDTKTQESVFTKVWNFGKKVLSKLKSAFQEQSPSKATNQMGQYLLEGLSEGIKKQEKPVLKQVKEFGETLVDTLNNELDFNLNTSLTGSLNGIRNNLATSTSNLRTSSNAGNINNSSSSKSVVNNFTQNINAPKQPSRIEIYRQTRNLLEFVKQEG